MERQVTVTVVPVMEKLSAGRAAVGSHTSLQMESWSTSCSKQASAREGGNGNMAFLPIGK